ncbi:hypothetical protein SRHO_G00195820 [Serrasalmus rhombeus]
MRLGCGEGQRAIRGVGFIFSKEWASRITSCQLVSARIGLLNLRLSGKATLKIVQAYAPITNSDDKEVEQLYQELEDILVSKSTYTVMMGDFSAKIRRGRQGQEAIRGEHSVPDYILVDKRRIVQDISAIAPFNTGSDHRLVRGINEEYNSLVQKLKESLRKSKVASPKEPCGRILEGTKKMIEKRRNMKYDGSDLSEYSILCKAIRQHLEEDFEKFRKEKFLKAAQDRKSLKQCERKMALY